MAPLHKPPPAIPPQLPAILMISTSEIKISCVIDEKYGELAVRTLHDAFGLGNPRDDELAAR